MKGRRTFPRRDAEPRAPEASSYVRADAEGVLRVGGTRVSLDSVVLAFQEGHSPESIRQQYPALTLEAVYGAVTYYLAHRGEVDEYLRDQERMWQRTRDEADERPSSVVERLRAALRAETVDVA